MNVLEARGPGGSGLEDTCGFGVRAWGLHALPHASLWTFIYILQGALSSHTLGRVGVPFS